LSAALDIRVPQHLSRTLWEEVRRLNSYEPVIFGLVSEAKTPGRRLALVRELIIPPQDAFVRTSGHGAKWTAAYNIELINRALEKSLGIVIFHYHGGGRVQLSADDKQSARKLLPTFQSVLPTRPHGSVVLGDGSVTGMLLMPGERSYAEKMTLRLHASSIEILGGAAVPSTPLLDGLGTVAEIAAVKSRLERACVAIVGLSGGGSQVATKLATFGVGEIIGIDPQRVSADNLLATDELGWPDVLLRLRKTGAVKTRVWWTNRAVHFTPVNAAVPEPKALEGLKRADVIIGCVNNLAARSDIQEIAWRYCIPYIDIGLTLRPSEPTNPQSRLSHISGNVFTAIPGGACLWCTGFLSEKALAGEAGGANRAYLRSALVAQAGHEQRVFVATFNATIAALAASTAFQILVGYASDPPILRIYDGMNGLVSEMTTIKKSDCPKCTANLCAGDLLWQ